MGRLEGCRTKFAAGVIEVRTGSHPAGVLEKEKRRVHGAGARSRKLTNWVEGREKRLWGNPAAPASRLVSAMGKQREFRTNI